jgi:hypothetical protein
MAYPLTSKVSNEETNKRGPAVVYDKFSGLLGEVFRQLWRTRKPAPPDKIKVRYSNHPTIDIPNRSQSKFFDR